MKRSEQREQNIQRVICVAQSLFIADGIAATPISRIAEAAGVVLPGVGAFEDAMAYLRQSGQDEAILSAIGRGVPFLGICLGLQVAVISYARWVR